MLYEGYMGRYAEEFVSPSNLTEIVDVSLIPAPVNKVVNSGKGPFHFVLLKVNLKSYHSLGVPFDCKKKIR